MIGRTPDEIVAYRPLKDGVVADYYITKAMLTYFIRKASGWFTCSKPDLGFWCRRVLRRRSGAPS